MGILGNKEQEKTYRLGKTVLTESDLKIQIPYKGEVFTLRYPTPLQKSMIENEIARRLGGYPRASFSNDHLALVEACATIDILMIKEDCPKWFESPWTCLDEDLITDLFAGYFRFRDNIRARIRGSGVEESSKGSSS